jgi:phenylpropionate dioxygenase-like ring-hydroxylating dioxygenase large terminal subunit
MAGAKDSEDLTRVGPGTVMGEFMRQFWIPAVMSKELVADDPPMRLMLLGEKLIAFRDSAGRVGIMDQRCPHRCASMFFGRNEEGGIRCIYHGWKFDVDGNCLDQANVPPEQQFKEKVKAKAYRVAERNGLIWVYMGSAAQAPDLPQIEATLVPETEAKINMLQRECNWLQGLEGDIDTSHFGFLHAGSLTLDDFPEGHPGRYTVLNRAPEYKVADTEWGTMYGAYRKDEGGNMAWRIAHFSFPFWAHTPNLDFSQRVVGKAWVPMDDTHTMLVTVFGGPAGSRNISNVPLKNGKVMPGGEQMEFLPNTTDWYGRWRSTANAGNDYLIDREAQKKNLVYSGIRGIVMQDQAVTESMGPITDHSFENLAPTDLMIARTRRRALAAARAFAETGKLPTAATDPQVYRGIRSGSFHVDPATDWQVAYAEQLKRALRWPRPEQQAAE